MKYKGIALVGRAWAGKTTVAEMLANCGFIRASIARPVKDIARQIFGMRGKNRKLLQEIGTKMREIDLDVWINYCLHYIEAYCPHPVVIDDCRFLNEAGKLKAAGFKIVRVVRPGVTDPSAGNHPSETEQELIESDFTIINDGGSADLHKKIMEAINDW